MSEINVRMVCDMNTFDMSYIYAKLGLDALISWRQITIFIDNGVRE
jgi:hypothetical protein